MTPTKLIDLNLGHGLIRKNYEKIFLAHQQKKVTKFEEKNQYEFDCDKIAEKGGRINAQENLIFIYAQQHNGLQNDLQFPSK